MSLISLAYFRDFNNVSDNIEEKDIKPHIFRAEQELKFLIGKSFYDELVSQYESADGTSGLSADNLSFYDPYLIQWLAKHAYVYLLKGNNYKVTRTGIRTFSEDNSAESTDKIIGEIIKEEKQQVEQYKGRMIAYLRGQQSADSSKYPLYDTNTCADKFGTSFHITSVSKTEDVYCKITSQINNGA